MSIKSIPKTNNVINLPPEVEKTNVDPSLISDIKGICSHYTFDNVGAEYSEVEGHVTRVLNQDYSKVMLGGKSRLMKIEKSNACFIDWKEIFDHHEDLSVKYTGYTSTGNPTIKSIGAYKLFRSSMKAKKFANVKFNPEKVGDYGTTKNLFNGFKYSKSNAKFELTTAKSLFDSIPSEQTRAVRFFDHLFDNVANKHEESFLQLVAWLADIINTPHITPGIAVVMRGAKGSGKSLVHQAMGDMLGDYHFSTTKQDQAFGKFNDHLINKLLLVGEEMIWGGNRDMDSALKEAVTASTINVDTKFLSVYQAPKFYRVMMVANSDWVVNATDDERRWLVFDINPQMKQNDKYFEPLMKDRKIRPEAGEQIFSVLASINHTIQMTKAVETAGLVEQKLISMTSIEQWWQEVLDPESSVTLSGINADTDWHLKRIPKETVLHAYLRWFDHVKPKANDRESRTAIFGKKFTAIVSGGDKKILNSNRNGHLINRNLACDLFAKKYGIQY